MLASSIDWGRLTTYRNKDRVRHQQGEATASYPNFSFVTCRHPAPVPHQGAIGMNKNPSSGRYRDRVAERTRAEERAGRCHGEGREPLSRAGPTGRRLAASVT